MRHTFAIPLLLAAAGMAAGLALWFSGADVAVTRWLEIRYNQPLNDMARVVGWFGLGRNQMLACLLAGTVVVLRGRGYGWAAKYHLLRQALLGWLEQLALLLRGKPGWATRWRGIPRAARIWWLAAASFLLAGGLGLVLKIAIGRPRPKEVLWNGILPNDVRPWNMDAGFWSFPSGHSLSTFAVAVVLMLGFPRYRWPLLAAAVVLAASRFLALTPHYVGDVVAGAALGTAVAIYVVRMAEGGKPT